jgi:hypothetical protein
MPQADEYVETIVTDGFDRELEQEENIVRSLSFCATSLGILAAALSLAFPTLCPPAWGVFEISTYGLLVALGLSVLVVFCYLLMSVWPRRVAYPMNEIELLAYADSLRTYYANSEAAAEIIETAIIADIRETHIKQIAAATQWNRKHNLPRLCARDRAVTALVFAVFLAFVLLAVIVVRNAIAPGGCVA